MPYDQSDKDESISPSHELSDPPSIPFVTRPPTTKPLQSESPVEVTDSPSRNISIQTEQPINFNSTSPSIAVFDISSFPSSSPVTEPTLTPSSQPSSVPTNLPSSQPTDEPTVVPTIQVQQTDEPTVIPTTAPTSIPLSRPTSTPSMMQTFEPSPPPIPPTSAPMQSKPTSPPTSSICPGLTEGERVNQIVDILGSVADPTKIRNYATPQGLATKWIIEDDSFKICPDNPNVIQRWSLAVIYFSTGGDSWAQCSANGSDNCGAEEPFVGDKRFLSGDNECAWAGISCQGQIVTEIEFEENNLAGTIPTELGLVSNLEVWGMEGSNLTGRIPTEVGLLSKLIYIDLDFNKLTGTLTSELFRLTSLTQLDLNDNSLSGSLNGIEVFKHMEFLQIHRNEFTGTIPSGIGAFSNLAAFTLYETLLSGTMPQSICDLLIGDSKGGVLGSLIADCALPNPNVICGCCTDCRSV